MRLFVQATVIGSMQAVAPVCKESVRENAAVVAAVAVIVGAGERCKNRLEWLRTERGHGFGKPGEVGNAEHADGAVAPGLGRQPVDQVADVANFERAHELIKAPGVAAAAHVEDRVDVPAARKEHRVAAFHVTAYWREAHRTHRRRLEIFVISVSAEDDRKTFVRRRTIKISVERDAVRQAHFYIALDDDVVLPFRGGPLGCKHCAAPPGSDYLMLERMSSNALASTRKVTG